MSHIFIQQDKYAQYDGIALALQCATSARFKIQTGNSQDNRFAMEKNHILTIPAPKWQASRITTHFEFNVATNKQSAIR
ncbi:MAG: hypothetical protein H7240_08865 [Glaciimonas sp.]|nr:hypothetical protein [Glaciimonas sp.]